MSIVMSADSKETAFTSQLLSTGRNSNPTSVWIGEKSNLSHNFSPTLHFIHQAFLPESSSKSIRIKMCRIDLSPQGSWNFFRAMWRLLLLPAKKLASFWLSVFTKANAGLFCCIWTEPCCLVRNETHSLNYVCPFCLTKHLQRRCWKISLFYDVTTQRLRFG